MIDICSQDPDLITLKEALTKIDGAIEPVAGRERLSLKAVLGRILSKPVFSPINLPPDRNASMDGYAYSSHDANENGFALQLIGTAWAGQPLQKKIISGQCARIFTGAVVPEGADSVIMQELITVNDNGIDIPAGTKPYQNIREPGEDIQKGNCLIKPPKKLTAIDMGLLASAGVYDIEVMRKVKIAYFSTGDELIGIGRQLQPGQIYDSNRYTLTGLLDDYAYESTDLGVIKDNKQLMTKKLLEAANEYDVILSTGGASVGDADYIKQILENIGDVNFWRIAMKPGKPMAFGTIGKCFFFGLPGNPVSVITCFDQIVRPALAKLSGLRLNNPLRVKARCLSKLKKAAGRQEFQRGILSRSAEGELLVESAGKQGSHILSATSRANCYIILALQCTGINKGDMVEVEPFDIHY